MASFIPRLEWNDVSAVGDTTAGNPAISNVASTDNIKIGMIINHAAFPADAYVISKTINSITLNQNATATEALESFSFFERYDFIYPSTKQPRPEYLPTEQISESVGGSRQVQINNILKKVTLDFKFIPKALIDILESEWYLAWAVFGKEFRYFPSLEVNSHEVYEMDVLDFKPLAEIPKAGDFLYKISLKFRRVYL